MVRSSESDSVRKPGGLMLPPSVASSRSNAARADASDTCCSRIRWMSVAYDGSRAQSGGVPYRSTDVARAGSAFASSLTAFTSDRCVSGRVMGRASSRGSPVQAELKRAYLEGAGLEMKAPHVIRDQIRLV